MMTIRYGAKFKRDYKRVQKRGYDMTHLEAVVNLLCDQVPLPQKYRDHELTGTFKGLRECHIAPDWLLVYRIVKQELILVLVQTGTHSDLFGK